MRDRHVFRTLCGFSQEHVGVFAGLVRLVRANNTAIHARPMQMAMRHDADEAQETWERAKRSVEGTEKRIRPMVKLQKVHLKMEMAVFEESCANYFKHDHECADFWKYETGAQVCGSLPAYLPACVPAYLRQFLVRVCVSACRDFGLLDRTGLTWS